jgi:hypothetical protein
LSLSWFPTTPLSFSLGLLIACYLGRWVGKWTKIRARSRWWILGATLLSAAFWALVTALALLFPPPPGVALNGQHLATPGYDAQGNYQSTTLGMSELGFAAAWVVTPAVAFLARTARRRAGRLPGNERKPAREKPVGRHGPQRDDGTHSGPREARQDTGALDGKTSAAGR